MSRFVLHNLSVAVILLCSIVWRAAAQSPSSHKVRNIFEALSYEKEGLGQVEVIQPEAIQRLVGRAERQVTTYINQQGEQVRIAYGYRIQVYTGNKSSSKQEAYNRAAQVRSVAPEMVCYVSYKAPFWKLVAGDFATHEEASQALAKLKSKLPALSRNLYIVRERVRTSH